MQYLVCPGSADDMIWSIVNSKLHVVGATLDGNTAGTAAGKSPAESYCQTSKHECLSCGGIADAACSCFTEAAAWMAGGKQDHGYFLTAHYLVSRCRAQDHIH